MVSATGSAKYSFKRFSDGINSPLARPEMRAPVQKLIRRPSRSVPSIILALLLLTAGGLGAWLLGHRIVSGTWPDRAATTLDAVGSTTLGSAAVLVTAGIVAVCGLVMILSALWPGLPERVEILPDAVTGQTAVTRWDLAGLVRTQVEQVELRDRKSVV